MAHRAAPGAPRRCLRRTKPGCPHGKPFTGPTSEAQRPARPRMSDDEECRCSKASNDIRTTAASPRRVITTGSLLCSTASTSKVNVCFASVTDTDCTSFSIQRRPATNNGLTVVVIRDSPGATRNERGRHALHVATPAPVSDTAIRPRIPRLARRQRMVGSRTRFRCGVSPEASFRLPAPAPCRAPSIQAREAWNGLLHLRQQPRGRRR